MKIIQITDIHLAKSFGSVLGKYRKNLLVDLINKLQWVSDYAVENEIDAIVVSGDWFDNTKVGYKEQSTFLEAFCDKPFQVYGVSGQHDLPKRGHWAGGPLFAIAHATNFHIAGQYEIMERGGFALFPYGVHPWDVPYDEPLVMVVHDMITRWPVQFEHTTIHGYYDMLPVKPTHVLSGDYHPGYDVEVVGDTVFVNPGTFTRRSPKDYKRTPQMAVIDTATCPGVKYVPIEAAADGEEVFDLKRFAFDLEQLGKLKQTHIVDDSHFARMVIDSVGMGDGEIMLDIDSLDISDKTKEIIRDALNEAKARRDNE